MDGSDKQRGFTILIVIWLISIMSLMVAGFATLMRSEIKLAANRGDAVRAELLADAAAELAILDLAKSATVQGYFPKYPTGGAVLCKIGDAGIVRLTIRDEAGRIDLNSAGIPILEALFVGLGYGERASTLAATLLDFRDADDNARIMGAERPQYADAGLGWGPKNARLAGVEELAQVLGFDQELIERLEPYVTAHTEQSGIAAEAAAPALIELLRKGNESRPGSLASATKLDARHSLPGIFFSPSRRNVFAVRSEARSTSGAQFVREAVLRITKRSQAPVEVLRWRRGKSGEELQVPDGVPPCQA